MLGKEHLTAVTILALSVSLPSIGQVGDVVERTPADCLAMGRVRKQEVIDDATILYVLKDGRVYVNLLNESCPGLKEFGPPLYAPGGGRFYRTARVCAGNKVLVNRRPREFMSADNVEFSVPVQCPLGQFFPISDEQAEEIRNPAARPAFSITPVRP